MGIAPYAKKEKQLGIASYARGLDILPISSNYLYKNPAARTSNRCSGVLSFCFVQKRAHGTAGVETGVAGVCDVDDPSGGVRDRVGKQLLIGVDLRGVVGRDEDPAGIGCNLRVARSKVQADGLV